MTWSGLYIAQASSFKCCNTYIRIGHTCTPLQLRFPVLLLMYSCFKMKGTGHAVLRTLVLIRYFLWFALVFKATLTDNTHCTADLFKVVTCLTNVWVHITSLITSNRLRGGHTFQGWTTTFLLYSLGFFRLIFTGPCHLQYITACKWGSNIARNNLVCYKRDLAIQD